MHSPCSYLTPTASSSPEIGLTSVGDNPNDNGGGVTASSSSEIELISVGDNPNNNGDGRNDPNNNGDGRNDPNNNNKKKGSDDDNPALSPTKLTLKGLGITVIVGAVALLWTITLNPETFVKAVGGEAAHCYCSPDRAVQVEDLVPPSMRNPSLQSSDPESRWFEPGKNPNKKWLIRIIKDEQCECRSSKYFYTFMIVCNLAMLVTWWALLIMTYELPHVTCPVWATLWVVWLAYCLSTRRLYPGEVTLWKWLQIFYTALLSLFVCLRLSLAEKWKSYVRRLKKKRKDASKSFSAWLVGATEEAEAIVSLV